MKKENQSKENKIKREVFAALMAALTFVGTFIITIPTPTMGYAHVGDAFVLLSGLLLGPVIGGLAAGIGSALSDLCLGYTIYVVPTFLIKFVTAAIAGSTLGVVRKTYGKKFFLPLLFLFQMLAELNMVAGYFLFSAIKYPILNMNWSRSGLLSGISIAALSVPFNALQALIGAALATLLYPLFKKFIVFR